MRARSWIGIVVIVAVALPLGGTAWGREPADPPAPYERALAWLAAHQNEDGSWAGEYTTAVTGLACLAWLGHDAEPFEGEQAQPLLRGLGWLLAQQQDGVFPKQGHTWIHGQGFATLALAEAYGRTLFCEHAPDLDVARLKTAVTQAVATIAKHQSASGGWWYVQGSPHDHEGSTTVCAVQALVSAANFGIPIDEAVLAKGFEYLKRCQNPDGGFDYKEGPGTVSMKEGTAGDVATLALMRKFDYQVMTRGVDFLKAVGPTGISAERFPYYGHFYASMGLALFGEEMGAERAAAAYFEAARQDVLAWQAEDGSWPLKGWMQGHNQDAAYGTAFAALFLSVPEKRLSVFNRRPPELPKPPGEAE
jgi:hypothetical protein